MCPKPAKSEISNNNNLDWYVMYKYNFRFFPSIWLKLYRSSLIVNYLQTHKHTNTLHFVNTNVRNVKISYLNILLFFVAFTIEDCCNLFLVSVCCRKNIEINIKYISQPANTLKMYPCIRYETNANKSCVINFIFQKLI